ncbi:hypothetical protein EVG20_g10977 [Dentipellis fragilis]|uniref:Uncharacterized protein n=1 Tax=Dentipellis fragilis TaxID=205917 RepID=A0A4Y9XQ56_9AGAM|nr:hypothetical protein EVG20_g10977 [Dentipellis fragilis]
MSKVIHNLVEKLKPQHHHKEAEPAPAAAAAPASEPAPQSELASNTQPRSEPNADQQFTIQPHPATTNDPADLEHPGQQLGGGLNSGNNPAVYMAPGPQIPTRDVSEALPPPAGSEELAARSAELNQ